MKITTFITHNYFSASRDICCTSEQNKILSGSHIITFEALWYKIYFTYIFLVIVPISICLFIFLFRFIRLITITYY